MRIFIVSPANCATGGPEALHQFARCLIDNGIKAYMVYTGAQPTFCPAPEVYWKYDVPYVSRYVDGGDSVLVLPETKIECIDWCRRGTVMIWWLSVDNYVGCYWKWMEKTGADVFNLKARNNVIHFVQSIYARDYLKQVMGITEAFSLGDYISDEIIGFAAEYRERYERKNVCLYNPKKGYDKLEPVIKACRDDIRWIPLTGYKPLEMACLMCQAKVYVDFGSHPGKDRIPREAAVCGCCVLTNREGSAAYQEDVGIPEEYKIEQTEHMQEVLEKLYGLVDHYSEKIGDYSAYRQAAENGRGEFMGEVSSAIKIFSEYTGKSGDRKLLPDDMEEHSRLLKSLDSAADQIKALAAEAKDACAKGQTDMADGLLTMDYVMQVVRESVYTELDALAERIY